MNTYLIIDKAARRAVQRQASRPGKAVLSYMQERNHVNKNDIESTYIGNGTTLHQMLLWNTFIITVKLN